MKKILVLLLVFNIAFFAKSSAQLSETKFNGFGHVEFLVDKKKESANGYYSIGEHDFFVTSKLSNKISFLGEYIVRFNSNSATGYLPSIERSFVKFNYFKNHSIIAGKVHSPLNYWNDVYHHGRLFFPTIHRPNAFNYFVPIHTLGIQLQGQNLGKLNFGYDVLIGNGINSTDVFQSHLDPPLAFSFHIKPIDGMRIGASYYYDYLPENSAGAHTGHTVVKSINNTKYKGSINFGLTSFSFAYFGSKVEILNEFNFNSTYTDTLGSAKNFSNFLYVGVPFAEKHTVYGLYDYMDVNEKDLYTNQINIEKVGLGYKYEFNYKLNIKSQLEYERVNLHHHLDKTERVSLEVQLSYGF